MPACIRASLCGVDSRGRALWEIETTPLARFQTGTDLPALLADAMKDWPLLVGSVSLAVDAAVERANKRIKELTPAPTRQPGDPVTPAAFDEMAGEAGRE